MDIGFSGAAALRPLCRLVFATVAIAPLILAPAVSKAQSAAPEQPAQSSTSPNETQAPAAMPSTSMPPVVVQGGSKPLSIAPSATTPSQRVGATDNSYPPVTGARPIPASQLFSVPGEDPGYFFNLATYGQGFGKSLASRGIYLHGSYQQSDVSVVDGGHKDVSNYLGLGFFGADLDTEKAFGLKGGLVDFTITAQMGNPTGGGDGVGTQAAVPYSFGDEVRLLVFDYTQSFFDHALQITVGRMGSTTGTPYLSPGFHVTQFYCIFFTNSCGPPNGFAFNASKAPYEVGSWGGFITYHPAPFWYAKIGVFENQPLETTSVTHLGFPGRDWGLNEANGAYFPAQVGYITTPASSAYPTNFHIGGFFDSATYPDKYYNSRNLPAPLFPGAPRLDNRAAGMFAAMQQTVFRFSSDRNSVRGVALFFSGDWDIDDMEDDQQDYEAGFIITGPWKSRTADSINFMYTRQVYDQRLKEDRDTIAAIHGIPYTMQDQSVFEINYGLALAPGVVLYPYVQYYDHPDQLVLSIPDPRDTHATTVGVRFSTRFDQLFGLPQPGG